MLVVTKGKKPMLQNKKEPIHYNTFVNLLPKFWCWFCKTNTVIYYYYHPYNYIKSKYQFSILNLLFCRNKKLFVAVKILIFFLFLFYIYILYIFFRYYIELIISSSGLSILEHLKVALELYSLQNKSIDFISFRVL